MKAGLREEEWAARVVQRDGRCVVCGTKAELGAFDLLHQRLWPDGGGHYLDNGVALCGTCATAARQTKITLEKLRELAGIAIVAAPAHLTVAGERYDHWGNPITSSGAILRGELFWDADCQAALKAGGVLSLVCPHTKYPRTLHLPWSPGLKNDDRVIESLDGFAGEEIVVTEKMDGENTTLYRDHIHARSMDSHTHPSRHWVRRLHGQIAHQIPEGWRVCGENLFARHSIAYQQLASYLLVFSIWDERGTCLSWDETLTCADMLGLTCVPVLYRGAWDREAVRAIEGSMDFGVQEGYVVRVAGAIRAAEFARKVAKIVRAGHVQTDEFWMNQPIVPNRLAEPACEQTTGRTG